MGQTDHNDSRFPRWLIPAIVAVFFILAAGTAYLAYQVLYVERDASQVFPKYAQPKDMATAQLEQALQVAINRHTEVLSYLIYRVGITHVNYSEDKKTALLWLALYDKDTDTLVPAEPGLAIAQRQPDNSWGVTVQADDGFNALLTQIPASMIDEEIKQQYMSAPQAIAKDIAPLHGYRLPWKKGTTKFLTGSIGHVLTYKSCPSSCMYAFDFADGGNFAIMAAKAGRVKYAVWKYPDNNHENANYIVLEDDSTSPVTYQVYFHLSQNSIPEALRIRGAWVNQGQFIGNVDNTGYSSGPHLHFHVHTNATTYWGNSVDIVFDDVTVNGGRPRTCSESKAFPAYGTQCMPNDKYTSNNGDSTPPTGILNSPAANTLVTSAKVEISGYGSDESGVVKIQPMVKYDGTWRPASAPITTEAFIEDLDLCAAGVPDGPLSIGLNIWDNGGNRTTTPVAEVSINKKYTCPIMPPACSPAENQAALYNSAAYQGYCEVINIGEYADLNTLTTFGDNSLESIQLGSGVSAMLFDQPNFTSRSQTLTSSVENLDGLVIGANRTSSIKVVGVLPAPAAPQLNTVSGPDGAALTADDSVVLSWQPAGGALDYHAEVKGPDEFQAAQDWQGGVSYSLGTLKPGSYSWSVTARNSAGEKTSTGTFTVKAGVADTTGPITAPYEADFKTDAAGWKSTGLWKRGVFKTGTDSLTGWIFGTDSEYSKENSSASGDLTSPPISIGYAGQQLSFRYATSTESGGAIWDLRLVQISVDGGLFQNVSQITAKPGSTTPGESTPIDLSSYVGKKIRIRFHFDTLDGLYNKGLGWAITTVRISDDPTRVCSEAADDGSPQNARETTLSGTSDNQICPTGDIDFFRFTTAEARSFNAAVSTLSTLTDWKPALTLLSSDGTTVLAAGKASGNSVQLNASLPQAGTYFLKIEADPSSKVSNPAVDYRLSLIQDTTPPTITLTKPAGNMGSVSLPIELAANASDGNDPVSRVEFYVQSAGVSMEKAERVALDETAADGWTGNIPADYAGNLAGAAVFARAYDQAGNTANSQVVLLSGNGSTPVTHMDALPAENGSTLVNLKWATVSNEKVDHFELQYQVNGGDWQPWAETLPGDLREASFFGANAAAYGFRIRAVTSNSSEEFPAEAQVKTIIENACVPDKYETKDNLPSEATPLESGSGQLHNLCGLKDEDWSVMLLQGGKPYVFSAQPTELAAGVTLQIYDLAGQAMTDEAVPDDLMSETTLFFTPESSATYILRARAANDQLAGTRSIYSLKYDQEAPFSPLPLVCGAGLIPLLTALIKLWGRLKAALRS